MLGTTSSTSAIPKHSVLLLGAVLWRMRESGLLISDDEKWNISPTQDMVDNNYLDPINVPLLPEVIQYVKTDNTSFKNFNTKHFGVTTNGKYPDEVEKDIANGTYNWNNGLRPPMASMLSNINPRDGKDDSISTITCFPRADEWPALALGMTYAHDLDSLPGFKNPFKNQYKIFTPFLSEASSLTLRFQNQTPRWMPNKAASAELEEQLKTKKDYKKHFKTS